MSIYGYDSTTGNLEIRNPWGTESGQYWDTTFEISLTALLTDGDTISVDNVTSSPSVVTGALVSAAAGLQANTTVTSFTVLDSSANVNTGLAALGGDSKLSSIALTDPGTPVLALTAPQYSADAGVLAKITGKYALTVTGAMASAAAGLQANAAVTSFTVSDGAANVGAALAGLATDTKLSAIALTDTGTPALALTASQYSADASILAKITGKYAPTVTGALASAASGLQANAAVKSFTVSDSLANVGTAFAGLATDTKLSAIALTGTGTPALALTASQYSADAGVLAKITGKYALTVTGALASAAAGLQANAAVTSFTVSDGAANAGAAFAGLATDTKLSAIALTGTGTPVLALTASQYSTDASTLAKVTGKYALKVTGALASAAAGLQANAKVTSFAVSDTATNVMATVSSLNADGKLSALTVSGTASADTLVLTGLTGPVAATINMNGDTASATAGLTAPKLAFIGNPDAVTLGGGASTVDYALQSSSGIETIANFRYGLDQLDINLNGAATSVLRAAGTICNGQDAITLYSNADQSHGVVLTGVSGGMTAAALLANHLTFSGGYAVIT